MVKVCKPDGEGTIAGTRGNGEDAPISAVRGSSRKLPGSIQIGPSPIMRISPLDDPKLRY